MYSFSSNNASHTDSSLTLDAGNYLVYLSYADAKLDTTGGVSNDNPFDLNLSSGTAVCNSLDQKGYSVSGENNLNGVYATLTNNTKIYRCSLNKSTTLSYTMVDGNNYDPKGVIISAIKISGNDNFTAVTSGGVGAGSYNGVAGPVLTNGSGQTTYGGRYLANVIPFYFNVTTGEKCDSSAWVANYGLTVETMKTGCLRFFAYMEDNLSYTMILDRDTNIWTAWGVSGASALTQLKTDTDSWVNTITPSNYTNVYMNGGNELSYEIKYGDDGYKARLITTSEIAHITGNANFNAYNATKDDWYYLDGLTSVSTGATWQTQIATASEESAYKWLFNYTNGCKNYGCDTTAGVNTGGYWTSDAVSGTYDYSPVWAVTYTGKLESANGGSSRPIGVRPVITVLKSVLQ